MSKLFSVHLHYVCRRWSTRQASLQEAGHSKVASGCVKIVCVADDEAQARARAEAWLAEARVAVTARIEFGSGHCDAVPGTVTLDPKLGMFVYEHEQGIFVAR